MPFEIYHRDALPPDKYKVGESSLGVGSEGERRVGGGVSEVEGGEGSSLTLSEHNPLVENILFCILWGLFRTPPPMDNY